LLSNHTKIDLTQEPPAVKLAFSKKEQLNLVQQQAGDNIFSYL